MNFFFSEKQSRIYHALFPAQYFSVFLLTRIDEHDFYQTVLRGSIYNGTRTESIDALFARVVALGAIHIARDLAALSQQRQ